MTNKEYLEMAIEEMERYERNWSFMTAKEKRNIGLTKKELKQRIKAYQEMLKNEK